MEKWENTASNVILSFGKSIRIVEKAEMKDIEIKARFVKSGIRDLADRLGIDYDVLLHFILNTPEANIKLLKSHLKSKKSIRDFILGWEYVEDMLDKKIIEVLEDATI